MQNGFLTICFKGTKIEIPPDCDCRTIPLMQHPRLIPDPVMWPAPFAKPKKASRACRNVTPSKIDKCSRYLFPLLFVFFNGIIFFFQLFCFNLLI